MTAAAIAFGIAASWLLNDPDDFIPPATADAIAQAKRDAHHKER